MISSIKKGLFSGYKFAELIFFPSFCKICSKFLEFPKEKVVCRSCWQNLKGRESSFCLCCGRFFNDSGEPHLCSLCLESKPPYALHRSCGRYSGTLKDIILLFKYKKFSVLGKGLASYAFQTLGDEEALWWGAEGLVPVPLHPRRQRERGFNQSQILAGGLGEISGISCVENSLVKTKNVPPQTSLEAKDREKNVRKAFAVRKPEKVEGKVVLLIDDVFTTGATLLECSRVLLRAGAKEVRALTLAQA